MLCCLCRSSGEKLSIQVEPAQLPFQIPSHPSQRLQLDLAQLAEQANAAVRRQPATLPARSPGSSWPLPAQRPLSLANRQALDVARRRHKAACSLAKQPYQPPQPAKPAPAALVSPAEAKP